MIDLDLMSDEQLEQLANAVASALALCWFAHQRQVRRFRRLKPTLRRFRRLRQKE